MDLVEIMRHVILDIETDSLDINRADVKIIGMYDIEEDKYMILKYDDDTRKKVIEYLKKIDWVITFNGVAFDLPILDRHKIKIPFWRQIDLYQVIKKRTTIVKSDGFDSFSLRNIIKELKLDDEGKGDIDYNVFKKSEWTEEEKADIIKYAKQDLLLTFKLWSFLLNRFKDFAQFISEKDVSKYKHITSSSGAFSYKAICKMANIVEEYSETSEHEHYQGGYVATPLQESAKGVIVCLDFASLYPFMNIQGNLYSLCKGCDVNCNKYWHGDEVLRIEGKYCSKHQGIIEQTIMKMYLMRKEYKKNKDSREYVLKIILNSLYGITGNESFIKLFNNTTASDCTALGRQCIKYARQQLNEEGYVVLYSDTDSAYVLLPEGKTIDDLKNSSSMISKNLSSHFPFGWSDEFTFKVDEVIKYICFFNDEDGVYKKKMYLYVNDKDKLIVKGLKIVKLDCSPLSQRIFEEHLKPQIIFKLDCKFERRYIEALIKDMLGSDINLGLKRFNVKDEYGSNTSIQEQIRKVYGSGEVKLIKNFKLGVGKGTKYCSPDEAKLLRFEDLDLSIYFKELEPFIKGVKKSSKGGLNDYF